MRSLVKTVLLLANSANITIVQQSARQNAILKVIARHKSHVCLMKSSPSNTPVFDPLLVVREQIHGNAFSAVLTLCQTYADHHTQAFDERVPNDRQYK
jgi:hypothetical protein